MPSEYNVLSNEQRSALARKKVIDFVNKFKKENDRLPSQQEIRKQGKFDFETVKKAIESGEVKTLPLQSTKGQFTKIPVEKDLRILDQSKVIKDAFKSGEAPDLKDVQKILKTNDPTKAANRITQLASTYIGDMEVEGIKPKFQKAAKEIIDTNTYDYTIRDLYEKSVAKSVGERRSPSSIRTTTQRDVIPDVKGYSIDEPAGVTSSVRNKTTPYAVFSQVIDTDINKGDKYEIETLFKSTEKNAVTKVNMFGREVNLTALTDRVQMAFDWIGILVPPIDLINAAWYMGRGRTFEALISIIALIPGVGDALAICFRWLFRVLSKGGKLTTELISRMFKTVPAATRLSADVVIGSVKHAKEFVFLCRRLKLISPATSQAMVREIDNVLKGFEKFKSLSFRSSKKALSDPVTQRQISRRIGVTVAKSSEPVLKQTREKFNKLLSRTGKLVWDWLFTKSRNYWKNAYAVSVKQFKQVFVQEGSRLATKGGAGGADKLAILLVSFTDKSVTRSFVKRIADDLVKVLPADSTGKVFTFGGSQRTKAQIIDYITNQPARCLKIYYQKVGVQAYNKLIDDLIAKSVSIGDNINAMWYAFWTDPVRRFINENIKFARIRGLKGGTSSGSFWNDNVLRPLKNTVSDLFDAFKGFFNTQDFLKRLDIIYNELQEYYERHDYPAEYGKDLNQQSLIYYIFDETWKDVTGKYFTDSQFDIDASLQAVDASYATYVATKLDATKLGEIDSLSFQGYYYTDPGSIRYNMAFLEQNVNQKTMEYVGKPTSYNDKRTGNNFKLPGWPMWKVIKDTQTGLKEGTIWLLDPDTKRMYTNAYDPEKSGKLPAAYQEFYNKQKALSRLQSQKQIK